MVNSENILKPTGSKRLFVIGGILLVIGLIAVLRYTFEGTNTPVEGNAPADAAWQSATIIGGALFTGVGVLLLVVGWLKRRRQRRAAAIDNGRAPQS